MPIVSVIIPNYNHAGYLPQRVNSVLNQTLQDFELWLLDDCSTDDSQRVLRQYATDPRVRCDFNERNSGSPFAQWNKGVRLAQGRYVWIAESDDWADPRLLETLVGLLEKHPRMVFAYCRSEIVDSGGRPVGQRLPGGSPRWDTDFLRAGQTEAAQQMALNNSVPNASGVVFRKDVYLRIGGADESYRVVGDWKTWTNMMIEGDVGYVAQPLNFFRYHAGTARASLQRDNRTWGEIVRLTDDICRAHPALVRSWRTGLHLQTAWRSLGAHQWSTARRHALQAVGKSPLKPYCWRILLWALAGRWGARFLRPKNPAPAPTHGAAPS